MLIKRTALVICLIIAGIFSNDGFAQSLDADQPAAKKNPANEFSLSEESTSLSAVRDDSASEDVSGLSDDTMNILVSDNLPDSGPMTGADVWEFIKGRKAVDAILLAMWSFHFDATGSLFGDGRVNEVNNLVGLQLYGFNAGTFINSHHDRAYFLGVARRMYTDYYWDDEIRMDIGYNAGVLYGYGDELINLGGFSVYVVPNLGFTYKGIGIDFGFVPAGVLTVGFRVDFDWLYAVGQPRN